MSGKKKLLNERFGRLLVIAEAGRDRQKNVLWVCKCDCGETVEVTSSRLTHGVTRSCGCFRRERVTELKTKHGHSPDGSSSPTYISWAGMISRCTNPNCKRWDDYGGRGITVAERWLKFENFLADMGERPSGLTLERYDVNGNYCPDNCGWESAEVQAKNRRTVVTYQGITAPLIDHCKRLNLNYNTVRSRINWLKWSSDRALSTPMQKRTQT